MHRFHRFWTLLLLILLGGTMLPGAALAAPQSPDRRLAWEGKDAACARQIVWDGRLRCLDYLFTTPASVIALLRLPATLPPLEVEPLENEAMKEILPFTYAYVNQNNVPVYRHPAEGVAGAPPKRILEYGYLWVSVEGKVTYEGSQWYQINEGEYVPASTLSLYEPSRFRGIFLPTQPATPFARILRAVRPRQTPSGEVNPEAPLRRRYELVNILEARQIGDQVWYRIGPDQWINQIYVGKVEVTSRPPEVGPNEKWIDVNLFEQTLAAYEGDRMVYATLVSSGLPGWDTPPGLFRIWVKVKHGKMSGSVGKPDYYYLEDVPWTMYFNRDIALHGAYWHDSFGYKHSHGCVNLAPADAYWLFQWTTPYVGPDGPRVVYAKDNGTWVRVRER